MLQVQNSRKGRRLKSDEDRRSESVKLRVRPSLRSRLEAASAAGGRKLSAEAERRLEMSFEPPEVQIAALVQSINDQIRAALIEDKMSKAEARVQEAVDRLVATAATLDGSRAVAGVV